MQAVTARNNMKVLGRLQGEDLIAAEVVYHGSCLATYISK